MINNTLRDFLLSRKSNWSINCYLEDVNGHKRMWRRDRDRKRDIEQNGQIQWDIYSFIYCDYLYILSRTNSHREEHIEQNGQTCRKLNNIENARLHIAEEQ